MEFFAALGALVGLGVWTSVFMFLGLFIWLIVGTAYDRTKNSSAAMWMGFVVVLGLVGVAVGSLDAAIKLVTDTGVWLSIAGYLGIGLLYSWLIEFPFAARRASKKWREVWESFLSQNREVKAALKDPGGSTALELEEAKGRIRSFVHQHFDRRELISVIQGESGTEVLPKVNRRVMVDNVTAWSILWPAYAVSLLVGDLFTQIVESLVDLMSNLSGRFVKWAFADTFKV